MKLRHTFCGYAVPFYDFKEDRNVLTAWTERKNESDLEKYWKEKNMTTIDGKSTGMKF